MLSKFLKDRIKLSNLKATLDQAFYGVMGVVLLIILIFAYIASHRPLSFAQYQKIQTFSQQASHPKTQYLAHEVLSHNPIYRKDYLKLLRAYQFESRRIKEYPAMGQEDE